MNSRTVRILSALRKAAARSALNVDDDEAKSAWREIANVVKLYLGFQYLEILLDGADSSDGISKLLGGRAHLSPQLSNWAAISIGYRIAARLCEGRGTVGSLIAQYEHVIPKEKLIPIHEGIGCAFASHVFESLSATSSSDSIDEAIATFERLCRNTSSAAHSDFALEALGLVCRARRSELVPMLDQRLREFPPALSRHFWRGVGRASYLTVFDSLPLGDSRQARLCALVTAVRSVEQRESVKGFAYEATLTNLEHPFVLESYVSALSDFDEARIVFADGVRRACDTWRQCVPNGDRWIARFVEHVPSSSGRRHLWQLIVSGTPSAAENVSSDHPETFVAARFSAESRH